jgi:hypothetical protein
LTFAYRKRVVREETLSELVASLETNSIWNRPSELLSRIHKRVGLQENQFWCCFLPTDPRRGKTKPFKRALPWLFPNWSTLFIKSLDKVVVSLMIYQKKERVSGQNEKHLDDLRGDTRKTGSQCEQWHVPDLTSIPDSRINQPRHPLSTPFPYDRKRHWSTVHIKQSLITCYPSLPIWLASSNDRFKKSRSSFDRSSAGGACWESCGITSWRSCESRGSNFSRMTAGSGWHASTIQTKK